MPNIACPRCSKLMPTDTAFCRRCGYELRSIPAHQQTPGNVRATRVEPQTPAVERTGRPTTVWVTVLVLVIGMGAAFVLRWSRFSHRDGESQSAERPAGMPGVPWRGPPTVIEQTRPPLPPLPPFTRHLPADLPPAGSVPAELDHRGQLLTQSRYGGEKLSGAIFAGAHMLQVTFEKADLRNADFRGAELLQSTLAGADLDGAKFDGARFSQSYLTSIDTAAVDGKTRVRNGIVEPVPPPPLPARNVNRASFRAARFEGTDFEGMDLAGADFSGAEFQSGSFRNTDLRGANLRDTRQRGSNFLGAKLNGADLCGADLTGARNLTDEQLATAKTDENTRRPRR